MPPVIVKDKSKSWCSRQKRILENSVETANLDQAFVEWEINLVEDSVRRARVELGKLEACGLCKSRSAKVLFKVTNIKNGNILWVGRHCALKFSTNGAQIIHGNRQVSSGEVDTGKELLRLEKASNAKEVKVLEEMEELTREQKLEEISKVQKELDQITEEFVSADIQLRLPQIGEPSIRDKVATMINSKSGTKNYKFFFSDDEMDSAFNLILKYLTCFDPRIKEKEEEFRRRYNQKLLSVKDVKNILTDFYNCEKKGARGSSSYIKIPGILVAKTLARGIKWTYAQKDIIRKSLTANSVNLDNYKMILSQWFWVVPEDMLKDFYGFNEFATEITIPSFMHKIDNTTIATLSYLIGKDCPNLLNFSPRSKGKIKVKHETILAEILGCSPIEHYKKPLRK
jgi:hypothetical protein